MKQRSMLNIKVEDHVSHIFKNPPGGKNNFVEYQLKNIHFLFLGLWGCWKYLENAIFEFLKKGLHNLSN